MPDSEHYGKLLHMVTWKVIVSFFFVLCSRKETLFSRIGKSCHFILYLWYLFFYFSSTVSYTYVESRDTNDGHSLWPVFLASLYK